MSWKTEVLQCTSAPLHLYNRGVNGELLFHVGADYSYFLELVVEALPQFAVELLLYTLMPNHYHLALVQDKPLEVSGFIREVCWRFAKHYNKKHKRYGPLFAGRFRAKQVCDDAGLLRLSHYIHMNPVNAGLSSRPEEWRFSSCKFYVEEGKAGVVNARRILKLIGGPAKYRTFLAEYNPAEALSIYRFLEEGGKSR